MSTYTGKTVTVNRRPAEIAEQFKDLSNLQGAFDNLSDDQKGRMGEIRLEPQAIIINNPMIGEIRFTVTDLTDSLIRLACEKPMPMSMNVAMAPAGDAATELSTTVDVNVPMMLKPLVGPLVQKAADSMGYLVQTVANADNADASAMN